MFTINLDDSLTTDYIHLNYETLQQLQTKSDSITLHFGMLTKKLSININATLKTGEINIPQKISPEIIIPNLPYDHYFRENHLFLGPVIGYLAVPKYYRDPTLVSLRFINYDQIKGLIFLFRPNTLHRNNDTISGKYFDPATKTFVQGIFPYPSVIFNRTPLSRQTFLNLKDNIGCSIFNYPFFNTNKLNFWDWMSKEPSISPHLPQTTKLTGTKSLLEALNKHKAVYLKPTSLSQGRGILHVVKSGSNYLLSDRFGKKQRFTSSGQFFSSLQKRSVTNREYIIQQAIPFLNASGNKIDFRIYIQKDYSGEWKYSGMETKVAKKGSIISNSSNREKIVSGQTALRKFFGMKDPQIKQKREEIVQLCIEVLKVMEKNSHHLGDAALDFVLDKNHKVWLLEVQLNYAADKKAKRTKAEQRVLPYILPTPFEYAKALSGF